MTSPPESKDLLYESLSHASRQFVDDVLGALAPEQSLESAQIFKSFAASMAQDPERWTEMQTRYYQQHLELWRSLAQASDGGKPALRSGPAKGDRRFHAPAWEESPFFNYVKQSYLLSSSWLTEMVEAADLDSHTKDRLRFFTRQLIDAAAPTNFTATNPEVLKLASETRGDSLLRGLENLTADLRLGRISTTDDAAFEVGRNLAVTPGEVVFENELMQLIQYRPTTETVYERPLILVPPFINKYYILDLQQENSFVRYAVAQGHTVFILSWRNVSEDMGRYTWDQYLEMGVIRALDAAREICGVEQVNVLGFCVGGTLLASALAVLHGKNKAAAASMTLLASMLDYSDTGELSVFVDEAFVRKREQQFEHGGVLHGSELALTFSSLRPNDLIWNYVVNNYLKGRKPDAFDLLYWNSDSTNLPGAMYVYYLRNTYLENNLRVPGKLMMCGVPVDLSRIKAPAYILGSREDHIVPWKTAYKTTGLLGGDLEFVLAASGHIAGIINPASKNRRHYWVNTVLTQTADEWLAGARSEPGSWWTHWSSWLAAHSGSRVPARTTLGSAQYPALEAAPGRYVKQSC